MKLSCIVILTAIVASVVAESSASRSMLCSPYTTAEDLDVIRRSIAAAAQISDTRVQPLQTPTANFAAYCYHCITAAGAPDVAANSRLETAGEFKLLGTAGTVQVVNVGTAGLDPSQWNVAPPTLKDELIAGEFTTTTLAVMIALIAIVLIIGGFLAFACRRRRSRFDRYHAKELDRVATGREGDELAEYPHKSVHPVQDTSLVTQSTTVRAVLPLYAVSEETIDRIECQGYLRMEDLQHQQPEHLDAILVDIDATGEQRQRLEVAISSFTSTQ